MKFLFDLDPTITEQLYHHSLSQAALLTAVSAHIFRALMTRIQKQARTGTVRFRDLEVAR